MAPTVTTNSTSPLPTGQDFGGDEFSNNLFSDLAPLLTLFGEQVTKQFLSMSMGWADDILLAMGPLGIMTVIVSAIRVGGIKTLKAFVGRARESRANAEKEILSSTSDDVCELWSGREIVRELGNPEGMKDIILLEEAVNLDSRSRGTKQFTDRPILTRNEPTRVLDIITAVAGDVVNMPAPSDEIADISNGAPNIALNVHNSTASTRELTIWAIVSVVLQCSALAFPAITTYYLDWKKGGSAIAVYGYPCFATGTIAVVVGMILCGRVIEGSTTEHDFKLQIPQRAQIMRLQKACTVSDQHFSSYAIFNSSDDTRIRTSRRNEKSYSRLAAFATLIAIVGFVCQFVGLRALHWSATIYQLGIMLFMTLVRSLVRRGLAADPISYPLLDGHELAWLTLYMIWKDEEVAKEGESRPQRPATTIGTSIKASSTLSHTGQRAATNLENEMWVDQPLVYSESKHFEPLQPRELTGTNLDSAKRSRLNHILPWRVRSIQGDVSHEGMPEQRMLANIVRWEPLTGYQSIEAVRQSFRSIHSASRCSAPIREVLEVEDARLHRAFFPLSQVGTLIHGEKTVADDEPLIICRDLQRLMPNSNDASEVAASLGTAIERTMAFLAKSNHVSWHERQDPFKRSRFNRFVPAEPRQIQIHIPMLRGRYESIRGVQIQNMEISVNGKDPYIETVGGELGRDSMIWTTDKDIITSFISLWSFTLELRKSAASKAALAIRKLRPQVGMQEIGSMFSEEIVDHRNIYSRVVGTIFGDEESNTIELEYWMDQQMIVASPLGEEEYVDSRSSANALYAQVAEKTLRKDRPINAWVVWGLGLSSMSDPKNHHPWHNDTESSTSIHPQENHASNSTTTPDGERTNVEFGSNYVRARDLMIRTRPDTTIAEHCALEMFAYFMETIAAKIKEIGGCTSRRRTMICGKTSEDGRTNSVLESIANECVTAGLAHDVAEAYTVILPAFSKKGLLPSSYHGDITFANYVKQDSPELWA